MMTFVILAAVLTVAVATAIAVPLLRRDPQVARAPWVAAAAVAVLGIGASALYVTLSNWSWSRAAAPDDSPRAMVSRLARQLMANPRDLNGWLMLGRSYMALNETELAVRAYERANQLSGGKNADALVGLAEGLAVEDESSLAGRAGQLIEKALAIDPTSAKALFMGAAAALHRGDLPLARQRFAALLALDPPDAVKSLIEQQVSAIDHQLASNGAGAGPPAAGGASAGGAGVPAGAASAAGEGQAPGVARSTGMGDPPAAAAQRAAIRIRVALSPKLGYEQTEGVPLYVFVRDPKQPGPPLAVKRLETRFPQAVELSAADAMIAGRTISAGEDVQVVARIARSGSPIGKRGDPFGETAYHVGSDRVVDVVIDRLTP